MVGRLDFALTDDLVDDALDRFGGDDYDADFRSVFFRSMKSRNEVPCRWLSTAPLIVRSLVKPPIQCVKVDLKNKNAVKQVNKLWEIPSTTAEECCRLILVGD